MSGFMKQNNSVCPGEISLACIHIGTINKRWFIIYDYYYYSIFFLPFLTYVYPLGTKMKADKVRQMIEKKMNEKKILE